MTTDYIVPKTPADVAHLAPGMTITADLAFDDGNTATITSEAYEHAGRLMLAGTTVRYLTGEPATINLMALHDPLPAITADPRFPKGQVRINPAGTIALRGSVGDIPWSAPNGRHYSDHDVQDWEIVTLTPTNQTPSTAPGYDPATGLVTISLDMFDVDKIADTWGGHGEDPWRIIPDSDIEKITAAWLTTRIANAILASKSEA